MKIEMNTKVEVVCPYRDGATDKYNVWVEFISTNHQNRMTTPEFTDILDEFAAIEEGISGEDLTTGIFSRIKEDYDVRELSVNIGTPYNLSDDEQPKVVLYVEKSEQKSK